MKTTIIVLLIPLGIIVYWIYWFYQDSKPYTYPTNENNGTTMTVHDAPTPHMTEFRLDGSSRKYLPIKKYKRVPFLSQDNLDELGDKGWKLVTVYQGIGYFEKDTMGWVEQEPVVFEVK